MEAASSMITARDERLAQRLGAAEISADTLKPTVAGKVVRMIGLKIEAAGCTGAIGGRCLIKLARHKEIVA